MTTVHIGIAWAVALLLVPAFSQQALGQEANSKAALEFHDYEVIQYIHAAGAAPKNILRLDNNGDIVLAARSGITKAQLEASGVLQSQIALLKTWRLLEEKDDTLTTRFPILLPEQTRQLRERTRRAAPALVDRLAPEIRRFTKQLSSAGREENAYSIIFSYILDGRVWHEFEERGLIDTREITAAQPLWSGEVWALYPARSFAPGTNSISDAGVSLKVNWTDDAIPRMLPFVADIATLARMFGDYQEKGYVEDERAREVFGPFDLFDENGRFTIPVIVEDASDPLYQSASVITDVLSAEAPALLELPALVSAFDFRSERQALVIAYHELMWDVLAQLEKQGLVQKPVAFAEPEAARPADIAALVFIVRSPQ